MLVLLVLACIDFANTSKIHANTSQYRPNTYMTVYKPVVVKGPVLVCIGINCVCICLYIQQLVCILFVYTSTLQTNTNIQTNTYTIQTQKKCMSYVRWMYVLCKYLCVLILIILIVSCNRLSRRIRTCQWILTVSAVITATACLFSTHTQPIRDDLMARPWPTCWCRRVCSRIMAHWLGHMCLPGSTPAACLPLKTEWYQCLQRVPAAVGPEYLW
jgi:hypothetical protein